MTRKIIFAYLRAEPLAFSLAVLLCTLGMTTAICVLWLPPTLINHATVQAKGIDLIVGAKGSALQNTLAGVYHFDVPNGNIRLAELTQLAKHPMLRRVIPISLGDSVGGARIVGASPDFYELYDAKPSSGILPVAPMEASVGASAAAQLKLALGDRFVGSHGLAEGGDTHEEHVYTVVGILAPTGRVIDHLVVTPLESVWATHASHAASNEPEATFGLVQFRGPIAMASLPRFINSQTNMQAASPAAESARLLANFGWVASIIQVFAVALIFTSMLALLAAVMQSLERHKTDVALLRAMGVKRLSIQKVLLGESLLVILMAAIATVALSVACMLWLSTVALPGIAVNPMLGAAYMAGVVGVALLLGVLATIPGIRRAFRLDIATQLSRS
jgi:putative ABC transport system permease protein